jgi:hypothetical protein
MASGFANTASPTIPLSKPIDVMPIWIADRNWVGSSLIFKAICADFFPLAASAVSLALLEVSRATSDIAKRPLKMISEKRRTISNELGPCAF